MIDVEALVFDYPTKRALHGVSLHVAPATITALVGPNGAGKTTLLRCLAALDSPYSGDVRIDGLDTREDPRGVHARIGYLPDFYGLYDELTVRQCLSYAALSHGLGNGQIESAVKRAAERVALSDRIETRAGELSRGLRQRLAIGQAIVHEPRVLLLDEPAAGLDPEARRDLSQLLLSLKAQRITLIVSSHILAELQDYSDAMIIIDDGRIAGGAAHQVASVEAQTITLSLVREAGGIGSFLARQPGVSAVEAGPNGARVRFEGNAVGRAQLLRALIAEGFAVADFAPTKRTMEDAYFDEVKKARGR